MIMRAVTTLCRHFVKSTRAVAAIEFAMILPVLMVIFLGSFDAGRAIAIYMKVRSATYALASITNQYSTIQASDMTSITGATSVVLAPYSSSPVVVTISQITISSKGVATVAWSYSRGGTARAQGSSITIPSTLDVDNTYLIFAEVSYQFTPMFGYFALGGIAFSDNLYVTPRNSTCIIYVPEQTSTACT
jgi:Flp pilus assembly protein TadG